MSGIAQQLDQIIPRNLDSAGTLRGVYVAHFILVTITLFGDFGSASTAFAFYNAFFLVCYHLHFAFLCSFIIILLLMWHCTCHICFCYFSWFLSAFSWAFSGRWRRQTTNLQSPKHSLSICALSSLILSCCPDIFPVTIVDCYVPVGNIVGWSQLSFRSRKKLELSLY